jgi:hypothetical protein
MKFTININDTIVLKGNFKMQRLQATHKNAYAEQCLYTYWQAAVVSGTTYAFHVLSNTIYEKRYFTLWL